MNKGVIGRNRRGNVYGSNFALEWETTSNNENILQPFLASLPYDFEYRINGGSWVRVILSPPSSYSILMPNAGRNIVEYREASAGGFPVFAFVNGFDKLKLVKVLNFGSNEWEDMTAMFFGCNNLEFVSCDKPTTSGSSAFPALFRNCSSLTYLNLSRWDGLSGALTNIFSGCNKLGYLDLGNIIGGGVTSINNLASFTDIRGIKYDGLDTSSVSNMFNCFGSISNTNLSVDFNDWDFSSVTNMGNFLVNTDIGTDNYNTLLQRIDLTRTFNGVSLHGGNAVPSGSGQIAKDNLIDNHSWIITDGATV